MLRSRPQRIATAVVAVGMLGIGFLPLFGGPGYEHALASGLLVPSAAAVVAALELSEREGEAPALALWLGARTGLWLALVAWLTAMVHGLRVGFCDMVHGSLGFVLTAAPGAVLGGVWGACVAEAARRTRRRILVAVTLSLAAPLVSIGVSLWRFYSSPMVFAFDPFVGYFSGTLYDTVVDAGTPLLTYRLGTAATLLGGFFGASLLTRQDGRLVRAPRDATTAARWGLALVGLGGSLAITACGSELGHWQTPGTIARELGGKKSGARCDAVYPDDVREEDAALLVRDCEEEIASAERVLGTRGPERITAFFFRDAGEKKRLMGAGDTYIAKPWRREVYLQMHGYPHPVLGHEIAHVVAGSFGRGPFRIAGAWGGLVPNPGWIEGVAVAASPSEDELTGEMWARAMMELGILPSARAVFSLDFLGQSAAKSYTVAGAFVGWMMQRYGADRVRAIYGGADPERATGKDLDALDAEFRADLAKTPLPPEVLAYAKAKFDRPAIFGRKCPHVVDALLHDADACREAHRDDRALALYGDVLERDPMSFPAQHGRALVELRAGDGSEGRAALLRMADDAQVPQTYRDRAEESLADWDFLSGAWEAAETRYRKLADRMVDEDLARTLEVKALAAHDPAARAPMSAFLLGAKDHGPEPLLSGAELGAWSAEVHAPLADYIVGKNVVQRGLEREGIPYLERAWAGQSGLPPRVQRELLRSLAQAACALGDRARIEQVRAAVRAPESPFRERGSGRLQAVEALLERCSSGPR